MSRDLELAPFVVTSDGTLFVNVAKLTTATELDAIVQAAHEEERAVFIGVMLSPKEAEYVMGRLDDAADEAAARIVGQRRRRRRKRDTPPTEK